LALPSRRIAFHEQRQGREEHRIAVWARSRRRDEFGRDDGIRAGVGSLQTMKSPARATALMSCAMTRAMDVGRAAGGEADDRLLPAWKDKGWAAATAANVVSNVATRSFARADFIFQTPPNIGRHDLGSA